MIKEIDINKIKFTYIKPEDLILSLDRLTRFKYPEISFYRVFSDILCKHLTYPVISKNQIKQLESPVLKLIVQKIWNESVNQYRPEIKIDKKLNQLLFKEILNTYNLTDNIRELTDNAININGVLDMIADVESQPVNLRRLKAVMTDYTGIKEKRESMALRFPVEKVVLCEGITEEILLPAFSKLAGFDFDRKGIKLISAGGKNQVAKVYCELKDELKIPVFILLDADAVETSLLIKNVLRPIDDIYLIKHGEFEDIFSLNLIKRTINKRYKNICECTISDFKKSAPMTKILTEFYRINELGDFQKADFAKELAENLKYKSDLTPEILEIVKQIKLLKNVN